MKKGIIFFLLSLAAMPVQLAAQVNPQKGYIITNGNDTIYGTIDYLTDARNVKEADDGIFYVSRLFNDGERQELLFAEFLLQGGVSLNRYYHDDCISV